MSEKTIALPPYVRSLLSFIWPLLGGIIGGIVGTQLGVTTNAPTFAGIGIVSWALGLRWYGFGGMGLRGGRPLMAGIGFAFMGWVVFLVVRFVFVEIALDNLVTNLGQVFFYTLLFEALCTHLWLNGTLFRSIADWRGPIIATVVSGFLFGGCASWLFAESTGTTLALVYFVAWGLLYAFIRLRTGSFLGMAVVQALHTLTVWFILPRPDVVPAENLNWLYIIASLLYAVLIWRLWPKQAEDIRV